MLSVKLICVGRLREKFYIDAFSEYTKRLNPYCRFECLEIPEVRLSDRPSEAEITAALDKEADLVVKSIPQGSYLVALCVEGKKLSSEDLQENRNCVLSSAHLMAFLIRSSAVPISAFPCRI